MQVPYADKLFEGLTSPLTGPAADFPRGLRLLMASFVYEHMTNVDQVIAEPFAVLACTLVSSLKDGPLLRSSLRSLVAARGYALKQVRDQGLNQ